MVMLFEVKTNSKVMIKKDKITNIFNNMIRSKQIHEAVLFVENTKGDFSENFGYGGKEINSPLFMASVTKLFVTACILILQEQKRLSLNDFVGNYIDTTTLNGLHIFKGIDYSHRLTLSNLLFQTSGLADGLQDGGFIERIIQNDMDVSFEAVLDKTKTLRPRFAPNTAQKAYYSDTNFCLLGNIIENVSGMPLAKVFREYICTPLGMTNTYLPRKKDDFIPNIYYKNKPLYRPNFMMGSFNYDSITTAKDLMRFSKAFWTGSLFPQNVFSKLSVYKKLQITMGPIYYGGGYMRIPLKSIFTLFMGKGELLGHSGMTGSFTFYYPYKDLYFVGDTNQLANPGLPIEMIMRLAMAI